MQENALVNAPQETIGLLGHQSTLLAHGQPVVHQDPQVLLCRAPLQQVILYLILMWLFLSSCKTCTSSC